MSESWHPKQIILLDDEQSVMFALKLLLGAIGYKVEAFTSADEAIEFAKNDKESELFICDLRMPTKSGLQVLEVIKEIRPELCFVLMSAHADDEEVEKAQKLGANGFLSKPFMPDDLHQLIAKIGERLKG